MNLQYRIELMSRLGDYMRSSEESWITAKDDASRDNGWFTPDFIERAVRGITENFLRKDLLEKWISNYQLIDAPANPRKVGIVMAGNIPLVGFHDLLCVFISGHRVIVKLSSKDKVLLTHLVDKLIEWQAEVSEFIMFQPMLKDCDAYIATGSNNSAGYFDYYFKKYPHIIRRNRTSVAVLSGGESEKDLDQLADDVFLFFGLGCRNVTKLFVPEHYDFIPLLTAFKKYDELADHHKYKNNYDYNLALHILNNNLYMSTPALILAKEKSIFSPISQLNYEFYSSKSELEEKLQQEVSLQALVGEGGLPFGSAQSPQLHDYADAVDTMAFLVGLY